MFNKFRQKIAGFISPVKHRQFRMYAAAKQSRLTSGWGQTQTSADAELITSLRTLRARCRQLVRDAAFAKRAKIIVINNIVGSGIGLQAQVMTSRGNLNKTINDSIEESWNLWARADNCHTGGSLHFSDFERALIGQVFEAGEVFIRKHYKSFGDSSIPFSLELIEAERVIDEYQPSPLSQNASVRMGIETDEYRRPIAYWIRKLHPGEIRFTAQDIDMIERVPAEQIIHLHIIDRWPQTRGEPWLHAVIRRLNDMDGYSEAEIVAARAAASYMGMIETQEGYGEEQPDGSREIALEPGIVERLDPGEKFNFINPNRPNSAMDSFMRMMLREVAAGSGLSYESLSRDYSQSNYSSSRLALIDDRDLWRTLQQWFIRSFREPVHRDWLQQAVLAKAVSGIRVDEYALNPEKFSSVRFKPRGWSWVDPTKEVDAYKEAVRAGFITVGDVISLTGGGKDLEDLLKERRQELDMMTEADLLFDTDPKFIGNAKAANTSADDTNQDNIPGNIPATGGNGDGRKNI